MLSKNKSEINSWDSILLKCQRIGLLLVFMAIPISHYLIFITTPLEKTMGAVQKIFYFHVGAAFSCYLAFAIVFFASCYYLATKKKLFDAINESAGEVGFVFCTIVLATGMIWGKAAWGVWFSFEPRLVTFLFLWLVFAGFVLLRNIANHQLVASQSAVLGIVGAVTVPVMVYSIKLLPAFKQAHPQVVAKGGLPEEMLVAMLFVSLSLIILMLTLLVFRLRIAVKSMRSE